MAPPVGWVSGHPEITPPSNFYHRRDTTSTKYRTVSQIYRILTNPVCRGLIQHKEKCWPGTHSAIIDEDLWDQVQARLQQASARRRGTANTPASRGAMSATAPLLGKIRDDTGDPLTPSHTQRHGRRFRYYISNRLVSGRPDPTGWRLPATLFEQAVADAIAGHLSTHATRHDVLRDGSVAEQSAAAARFHDLAISIRTGGVGVVAAAIVSGKLSANTLHLRLDPEALAELANLSKDALAPHMVDIEAPFSTRRRGVEMTIVSGVREPAQDRTLVRALRHAHRWAGMVKSGTALREIAKVERVSESYLARIIPLATLSPKIQDTIVTGTQPLDLSLEMLVRQGLPLAWTEQELRFGFAV